MQLSEKIRLSFWERHLDENVQKFSKSSNDRKRANYWCGFIEGALASGKIEKLEPEALEREASAFVEFFDDPDAADLLADLRAKCFSSDADLFEQLCDMAATMDQALSVDPKFEEKDALNRFLGFCGGILCDGILSDSEIIATRDRFMSCPILKSSVALTELRHAVTQALHDNFIDETERTEISQWLSHLVGDGYGASGEPNIGNVSKLDVHAPTSVKVSFKNHNFVVTGPTSIGTRSHVASLISNAGGNFQRNVTTATNYVITADSASPYWRTTHFGAKLQRANELIEQGYNIVILNESEFMEALNSL